MEESAGKLSAAEETLQAVKMRGIFGGCAVAALLLVSALARPDHHGSHGVSSSNDHHDHHDHQHHHDHHHHEGDMTCLRLSPPNADFGFALYKSLNEKAGPGKNVFFSPLGISSVLSMLSTGARGETHSQLFSSLGYSAMTQAQVDESYKHLFHMLGHSQGEQQLEVINAAAVRSGFSPLETFLNAVRQSYSGEVFDVSFTNPTEAAAQINTFIAGKTQDKIKAMVKDLDPATAMVLINCVFFRGQWEKPFNSNLTYKADFFVDETTTVQVDMMKRLGRYDIYHDNENETTVILLPYKGNTSMMIALPDKGKMKEVEGLINKDHVRHWHDSLYRNSVDLFLPKFSISAEASLETTLKEMGIINAFADTAEFNGISTDVPLKVSKASHKAVLSVDETGTEAAASTTLEIMPMSMPETLRLDRPFLTFILEHSTKSILFMGKINNPTAM